MSSFTEWLPCEIQEAQTLSGPTKPFYLMRGMRLEGDMADARKE